VCVAPAAAISEWRNLLAHACSGTAGEGEGRRRGEGGITRLPASPGICTTYQEVATRCLAPYTHAVRATSVMAPLSTARASATPAPACYKFSHQRGVAHLFAHCAARIRGNASLRLPSRRGAFFATSSPPPTPNAHISTARCAMPSAAYCTRCSYCMPRKHHSRLISRSAANSFKQTRTVCALNIASRQSRIHKPAGATGQTV